jgi:uroporphyrinogen III methyltransferase / synthase
MKPGKVFLIGAGPGDPGLLTLKGMSCIQKADVVVYDFLASPELLAHASASAQIIYVGKKGGDHTLPQDKINALIVEKAKQGLTVARLKGGDPFIFGRGGEEALELVAAGISFEIVPGVTSAIAAPAYAGIPLTHRDYTATLAIVTGHEDPTKATSAINWQSLAQGMGTIVFLMGVKNLPEITRNLIANGMSEDTPAALIRWGTTPEQETVSGTLKTIADKVIAAGMKPPAVFVVGGVVSLRERLKWFENKPLWGKRVIVTRAREQASDLVKRLSDLGAICLETPTIEVVPPQDFQPLDRAIANLSDYHWVVFTSVNGVSAFFDRLFLRNKDARSLGGLKTVSIGPATAARLLSFGVTSDILPESYRAESIIEAFSGKDIRDQKILLPRAEQARPILPVELEKMGAQVDEITAYETRSVPGQADAILGHLEKKTVDLVTFTSSSTATNFKSLLPQDRFAELMEGVTVACIGPITAQTAEKLGFTVDIVADTFTIEGLCDAILLRYGQG